MAAGGAATGTVAGRPQPQTTAEPAGGPFVRHAPRGRRAMYTASQGFSGFIANPMVSSPGWNSAYRLQVAATGGVNGTVTVAATADAPWSFLQLVQMKDAFGTQLVTGPGYAAGYLVPKYGGQFGLNHMRDPLNSPQFQAISVGASGTGDFQFGTILPFEFAKGYGVISGANAALLPVLQINTAPSSSVYSTAPGTLPAVTETVDADFYWLPNVPADPPGIGTTEQWIYQVSNPTIPSGSSQSVQLPRLGGYVSGIIFELRDSTNARVDSYPTRPKLLVDGVPIMDTALTTWEEDMAISTGIGAYAASAATVTSATSSNTGTVPVARDTGVMHVNYKASMSQVDLGLLDTGETYLSTNPGTQIELNGSPWPTISNSPATLNVMVGQIVPSGALVRGLPEA